MKGGWTRTETILILHVMVEVAVDPCLALLCFSCPCLYVPSVFAQILQWEVFHLCIFYTNRKLCLVVCKEHSVFFQPGIQRHLLAQEFSNTVLNLAVENAEKI